MIVESILLMVLVFYTFFHKSKVNAMAKEFVTINDKLNQLESKLDTIIQNSRFEQQSQSEKVDLVLISYPLDRKIAVLKVVREVTGLGLKDAKDLIEDLPCVLQEVLPLKEAKGVALKLEALGAVISFTPVI